MFRWDRILQGTMMMNIFRFILFGNIEICICQVYQLFAEFTLRIKNQMDDSSHIERHGSHWFTPGGLEYFGWEQFASVREVQRCISDNTLIFECDINSLTMTYDRL
ncbi:hypothetical protein K1719_026029 [Acacia pycnantha]|nr:hypothetical protein K1719_026029 [Acacia pycnantha]